MDDLYDLDFCRRLAKRYASSTAFLLAEPRVIVCDRFAVERASRTAR
jgi:hypothetical protein